MSNHAAPSNGAKWVLRGWRKAWEEFAQQYETAPQFVLEVRNGTRSLSEPDVIKELLDTYGRFDIPHEGLALGTTVGVISLMLGKKFGRRREIDDAVFTYQFHKQFEGATRHRFAIFSPSTKKSKRVKWSGERSARKTQLPVASVTTSTTPAVKAAANGPSQADLERLIEIHRLRVEDLELATLATIARVWSEAHVRVSQELVRLTLQRLDKEEELRRAQVQADAERLARIESGEFLHVTNVYEPPPVLPIPEPASPDDPDDEDEDIEPELSTTSDGEDDEELLKELEVPVEFAGEAPRGVESSDDDEAVVEAQKDKAPSGEERDMTAEILKGRILHALGLLDSDAAHPQLVVIGKHPIEGYACVENISAHEVPLHDKNRLPPRIRATVVLHECYDLLNFRSELEKLTRGSGGVEWVNGGVTRELLLEALRERFGEPKPQEKPATAAPKASPVRSASKGQKQHSPRVTFKLLGKDEFPSDKSWTNKQFVAEQVPTLPHGLCCKEIGEELARRAGLVSRKCTVGSIQLAFGKHLLDNPEDAVKLEMVRLYRSPQGENCRVEPYVVPTGGMKGSRPAEVAADATASDAASTSVLAVTTQPEPETATATVEPTTNGHATGSTPAAPEEPALPPVPAPAPVPQPSAPVQVAATSSLLSSEFEKALLLVAGSAVQARVQQLTEENVQLRKELEKVRRDHAAFKLRIRDAGEQLIADSLSGEPLPPNGG